MSDPQAALGTVALQRDPDGTVKYMWTLPDEERVESVLFRIGVGDVLPSPNSYPAAVGLIVCVSSQPGCNVGCKFCATGLHRARRNLTIEEIVRQVEVVRADHPREDLKAIFAGMGEPLLNYENVVGAATAMLDSGLVYGISLNTIGIPDRVRRLAQEPLPLNLYVSLHATTDETRSRLIPLNRRYPIAATLAAATDFACERGAKVRIGYLLLPGINDHAGDAERLLELLDPTLFHVQLLIWNEIEGLSFRRISDEDAVQFCEHLHAGGLTAHVMRSSGRRVDAGCGQLAGRSRPSTGIAGVGASSDS